ncbi:hypothetical protein HBN50_14605 [Halobacteriovorax sp. GB3]|uniref:hypothetical protein n=1 Tax=Halobacteriovorax sp. GB3 TaxID=2719615 RepID=UPI00235F117F|nr:hypothetical protein [Halobacteriovorax sp. GB3]MDD0854340.1 hypothetical protein [Halobacteriovorax sp. GB3]
MINDLLNLAQSIESKWTDGTHESFSKISTEVLQGLNFNHPLVEFENELAKWLLENELPRQINVYNEFGQPPVTLFNNEKFVIDLYFWMHADTSVHSHSFSGAFKVLFGRSVHEVFKVQEVKSYSSDVMKTDIKRESIELLNTGSIHPILSGNSFNHRVLHIDHPTVTLCIRTVNDNRPQWHHFTNGLSIEKKSLSQKELKTLFYYDYLNNNENPKSVDFLEKMIASLSISSALNLYEILSNDLMGMSEESAELIVSKVYEKYHQTEWFSIYESFYQEVQEYIYLEAQSPADKILEHGYNSNYPKELLVDLIEKIQGSPLNSFQQEVLDS